MTKVALIAIFLFSPLFSLEFSQLTHSAEMWWCKGCGLAYPASQKCCLNKDCPLFHKRR